MLRRGDPTVHGFSLFFIVALVFVDEVLEFFGGVGDGSDFVFGVDKVSVWEAI